MSHREAFPLADLRSLAHKDWPYSGTAHEWRGFVKSSGLLDRLTREEVAKIIEAEKAYAGSVYCGVYQKQNFGPELK
jgi:hypothetical protein